MAIFQGGTGFFQYRALFEGRDAFAGGISVFFGGDGCLEFGLEEVKDVLVVVFTRQCRTTRHIAPGIGDAVLGISRPKVLEQVDGVVVVVGIDSSDTNSRSTP